MIDRTVHARKRNVRWWRQIVLRSLRIVALSYLGVLLVLSALQAKLLFPGQVSQGTASADFIPPEGAELVELQTPTGERVTALFGTALTTDGIPLADAPVRPTFLVFYGNGQSIARSVDLFDWYRELGVNVLIPDYLGYGLSSGEVGEQGCYQAAEVSYQYLLDRQDLDSTQIVMVGWSLGGAVAIDLAAKHPPRGLAVFSTFTRMSALVRLHYPIPGLTLLLKHRFDSIDKIRSVTCPTLIGHGNADVLIPASMSDELASAVGGPVSSFQVKAGHNDFFANGKDQIAESLLELISRLGAKPVRSRLADSD